MENCSNLSQTKSDKRFLSLNQEGASKAIKTFFLFCHCSFFSFVHLFCCISTCCNSGVFFLNFFVILLSIYYCVMECWKLGWQDIWYLLPIQFLVNFYHFLVNFCQFLLFVNFLLIFCHFLLIIVNFCHFLFNTCLEIANALGTNYQIFGYHQKYAKNIGASANSI